MYRHHGRSVFLSTCVGILLLGACGPAATPTERVKVVTVLVTEQPTPTRAVVVTATRAATKTPMPIARAASKGDAGVLFEDHFDTDRGAWFNGGHNSISAYCEGSIDKGKYTLYALLNTDNSTCSADLPAFKASDGTLTVKASIASTTAEEGQAFISLLWRLQDSGQVESFDFYNDGTFFALHLEKGNSKELQKRTYSEYMNFKQGMTNVLSVTAKGDLFTVFANGHPLYAVTSKRAASTGKLAIQIGAEKVGQKIWVDFDDIEVTRPEDVPVIQEMIAQVPTPIPEATKQPVAVNTPRPRPTAAPAPTKAPPTAAPVADQYIMYFHFGAQGCPYSRRAGPAVETFYKNYAGRVQVIGVTVNGWGSNVQDFRNATGISFPVQNGAGPAVDTNRIPQIVIVNKRTGEITHISQGVIPYQSLANSVQNVMSGRSTKVYIGGS